jgi:hypothetical protein
MVKETFDRIKPHLSISGAPAIESFSAEIITTGSSFDTAELTIVGSSTGNYKVLVYATPPQSAGIMKPRSSVFRLLQSFTPAYTPSVLDFKSAYQARFGIPEIGVNIFLRIEYVDTDSGQLYSIGTIKKTTVE